jgi:hypothetical protein
VIPVREGGVFLRERGSPPGVMVVPSRESTNVEEAGGVKHLSLRPLPVVGLRGWRRGDLRVGSGVAASTPVGCSCV